MKIQYANELFEQLGVGGPTTCVYQFIYDEKDSDDTEIIRFFIMHGLGLCIAVNSYVAHRLYAWHRWELPVLHYHRIRVNYPYSCLGVIFGVILHVF